MASVEALDPIALRGRLSTSLPLSELFFFIVLQDCAGEPCKHFTSRDLDGSLFYTATAHLTSRTHIL
jgi:hypothetical protein